MTDQATTAQAGAEQTSASTTTQTSEAAAATTTTAAAPEPKFWEALKDESLRTSPNITRYNSVDDLAKALDQATKRFGVPPERLLKIPEKPDDAAGWAEIHKALGRPDDVAGYGVEMPTDLPDETKGVLEGMLTELHANGATTPQVQAVIKALNDASAKTAEARAAVREADTAKVTAKLKEDWGEKFDIYKKGIGKLINDNGGQELIDELNELGLGNSIGLNKLLATITDKLAEDDKAPGAGGEAEAVLMTPLQAQAARIALENDDVKGKALRNRRDPQHALVVAERQRFLAMENPKRS